jgi:hypothetical protein
MGSKPGHHSGPLPPKAQARKRELFLDALRKGFSFSGALKASGLARSTVHDWKQAEPDFRTAWEDAVEEGTDSAEDEMRRRAIEGTAEYVVSQGRLVKDENGTPLEVRKYSDNLLAMMLKARRPNVHRERVSTEISGPNGGPIETAEASPVDRIRLRIAGLTARQTPAAEDEAPAVVVKAHRLFD